MTKNASNEIHTEMACFRFPDPASCTLIYVTRHPEDEIVVYFGLDPFAHQILPLENSIPFMPRMDCERAINMSLYSSVSLAKSATSPIGKFSSSP